jgi:hypothetical protein
MRLLLSLPLNQERQHLSLDLILRVRVRSHVIRHARGGVTHGVDLAAVLGGVTALTA